MKYYLIVKSIQFSEDENTYFISSTDPLFQAFLKKKHNELEKFNFIVQIDPFTDIEGLIRWGMEIRADSIVWKTCDHVKLKIKNKCDWSCILGYEGKCKITIDEEKETVTFESLQ